MGPFGSAHVLGKLCLFEYILCHERDLSNSCKHYRSEQWKKEGLLLLYYNLLLKKKKLKKKIYLLICWLRWVFVAA